MTAARALLAAFAALLLAGTTVPPVHYRVDPAASDVAAKVAFLGLGSRTASFPAVSGSASLSPAAMDRINLDVRIDARQLIASDQLTTDRLKGKNFFDVASHPVVRFQGKVLTMTSPVAGRVAGELTARGVTRPVTLAVTFSAPPQASGLGGPIGLTGTTSINRRDFGMTAYSLIVGKRVTITIKARLVPA